MTTVTSNRRPYNADNVIILDKGHAVWVLWSADPDVTAETVDVWDMSVEVVAHLRRVYKRDGHAQGGWIIDTRGLRDEHIATNKPDAMRILRQAITDYFNRD